MNPEHLVGRRIGIELGLPKLEPGQRLFGYYVVTYEDSLFVLDVIEIVGSLESDRLFAERSVQSKHGRSDSTIQSLIWTAYYIAEPMNTQPLWRRLLALLPF